MLRIIVDGFDPRNSLERQRKSVALPFSPLFSRKSFSYSKLPEEPLKLSVLKLDGSLFDIQVMQTATVGDLKQAVEVVFSHMPQKGPGKISWSHVWGHFCLCYDRQKLVTETDNIRSYGIKDGDQLQFIRHLSTSNKVTKKKSKKRRDADSKQQNLTLSRSTSCEERSTSCEVKEQCDEQDNDYEDEQDNDNEDIENRRYWHYDDKDQNFVRHHNEYGLAHFLGGWFSRSRSETGGRMRCNSKASPLRFPCDFFDSFKKLIGLYGSSQPYSRRDTWRED